MWGSGSQIAGTRSRWESVARTSESILSVLQAKRGEALDLLGVGDLDLPALLLERVVDQAGAGHRLDEGADGLSVDLLDPPGEPSQRVGVGWRCQLV
jgi:hypothetical protein